MVRIAWLDIDSIASGIRFIQCYADRHLRWKAQLQAAHNLVRKAAPQLSHWGSLQLLSGDRFHRIRHEHWLEIRFARWRNSERKKKEQIAHNLLHMLQLTTPQHLHSLTLGRICLHGMACSSRLWWLSALGIQQLGKSTLSRFTFQGMGIWRLLPCQP